MLITCYEKEMEKKSNLKYWEYNLILPFPLIRAAALLGNHHSLSVERSICHLCQECCAVC